MQTFSKRCNKNDKYTNQNLKSSYRMDGYVVDCDYLIRILIHEIDTITHNGTIQTTCKQTNTAESLSDDDEWTYY